MLGARTTIAVKVYFTYSIDVLSFPSYLTSINKYWLNKLMNEFTESSQGSCMASKQDDSKFSKHRSS